MCGFEQVSASTPTLRVAVEAQHPAPRRGRSRHAKEGTSFGEELAEAENLIPHLPHPSAVPEFQAQFSLPLGAAG